MTLTKLQLILACIVVLIVTGFGIGSCWNQHELSILKAKIQHDTVMVAHADTVRAEGTIQYKIKRDTLYKTIETKHDSVVYKTITAACDTALKADTAAIAARDTLIKDVIRLPSAGPRLSKFVDVSPPIKALGTDQWQAIAGVSVRITDHLSIPLTYSYPYKEVRLAAHWTF